MTDFTLDGVDPGTDYSDLPIGSYVCVIDDCETGNAKTGTPQLRVQFKVVLGDYKGRVISDWVYFTQAAAGVVLTKITAAGVDPIPGIKTGEEYALKLRELLHGQHVEIIVREDEYKGGGATKIKAWKKPPESLQVAPVASNGASAEDDEIPF